MSPMICIGTRMQDCATWLAVGMRKNVKYPRLFQHPVSTAIHHEIGSGSWFYRSMQGSGSYIVCLLAQHISGHKLGNRPVSGVIREGKFCPLLPAASHRL